MLMQPGREARMEEPCQEEAREPQERARARRLAGVPGRYRVLVQGLVPARAAADLRCRQVRVRS